MSFTLQPMLCGAALRNKGVQMLLDAVVDILPNPRDGHSIKQFEMNDVLKTTPIPTICDPKAPLRAMVFKIMSMPNLGDVSFVRVYQGTIREGDAMVAAGTHRTERAARMVKLVGLARPKLTKPPLATSAHWLA